MADKLRTRALTTAGIYFAVASLYIVVSGLLVYEVESGGEAYLAIETAKGLAFVTVTSILLFVLVRRYLVQVHREATQGAATEQELKQRSRQLAAAQRIAHLGSWELDPDTGTIAWSEEIYHIFGVAPGDFEPRVDTLYSFMHADDRQALRTALQRTLAGEGPLDLELRVVRPDGQIRHVHARAEARSVSAGRAASLVGTVQDVTDRKLVELALERHDRQQAAIAELGMQALNGVDTHVLMERAMTAAARTLDVEYTKVLELQADGSLRLVEGIGWQPGVVGRARVEAAEKSQAGYTLAMNGPVVVGDLRTERRFSGPPLLTGHGVVSGISTVIQGRDGPWGVLGVHTTHRRTFSESDVAFVQTLANLIGDVQQREQAQQVLREHDFLRRIAAEAAGLGGWAFDLRTNTLHWSPEVARIHEMPDDHQPTLEEGIGFYVPEHRDRIRQRFDACMHDGVPYDEELQITTAKGRRLAVRAVGRPHRDAAGNIIQIHGAFQDISERKQLESMLHQSQRLEAVGHLTGGIAHDFNNLLTVIIGNADLMTEVAQDAYLTNLIDGTRQAAERGAELTSRLLAYARRQPLEPRPTNVGELLAHMDQLLRRSLGEHIQIENVRGGGLWAAMVDPAQLESAVLNLCLNARDAMPEGGRLTLETANVHLDDEYARTHHEVTPGQYVMIAVTDTGHGVPQEIMDRIFEPFFTTKRSGQGTGLGLSMVYGFVKQSRGHIKLYSEEGRGTTVRLYLPRSHDQAQPEEDRAGHGEAEGHGELVLVVEDDPMVQRFVADQVQRLGYRVLTAGNAEEALNILDQRDDVELLFTDVVMAGGMDGRQLADAAVARRPGLPILFTSGYTENAIVHQGQLDPGVLLLAKPYRRADLADKLRAALGRGKETDSTA